MRLACATLGLALVAGVGLIGSTSPAGAEPNIDDVQANVDRLYHEAEQAQERFHDAKIELAKLEKDLADLQSDEDRASDDLTVVRNDARSSILREFTSNDTSSLGSLLGTGDPGTMLEQMSDVSAYQQIQKGLVEDYSAGVKELGIRREATAKRLDEVAALKEKLADEKQTVDDKLEDAQALLDRLKEAERREILSRSTSSDVRVPADVPASGRAAVAVRFAMAQVGKSYVYGAEGPSAYDCSGLMLRAWGAAGVALPRSSSAQYAGGGAHIPMSALKPGDLVFFYSPISHVGMYIGNGMIVHASNPSTGVKVSSMSTMPYSGAVRPG